MLNRRMPNGTYWWWERGEKISPTRLYVVSIVWVSNCHVIPYGDSGVLVSIARKMLEGYYIDMEGTGCYMTVFPHQFSLVAVIQVLLALFGPENYKAFQHLNALCMPLLFYSGYKILQYICEELEMVFYYVLFSWGVCPCSCMCLLYMERSFPSRLPWC